ncbi:hypothetical protein [Actinomycetospora chlora]|uniref:hypothetical protein n=1 Tax=Actinomycetospora chlora TaxID=663608 RepID=UPI0031E94034
MTAHDDSTRRLDTAGTPSGVRTWVRSPARRVLDVLVLVLVVAIFSFVAWQQVRAGDRGHPRAGPAPLTCSGVWTWVSWSGGQDAASVREMPAAERDGVVTAVLRT